MGQKTLGGCTNCCRPNFSTHWAMSFGPDWPHFSLPGSNVSQTCHAYLNISEPAGAFRAQLATFATPISISLEKTHSEGKRNGLRQIRSRSTHQPPRSSRSL